MTETRDRDESEDTTASVPETTEGAPHHVHPPPAAVPAGHDTAHRISDHPEQGRELLRNGDVGFDATGELFPDGHGLAPHQTLALSAVT